LAQPENAAKEVAAKEVAAKEVAAKAKKVTTATIMTTTAAVAKEKRKIIKYSLHQNYTFLKFL
jgi:hypothetical protein